MTRFERFNLFSYQWSFADEDTTQGLQTIIKIFGWNEKNESVYVRIEDFLLPIYIELPDHFDWDENSITALSNRLATFNPNPNLRPRNICYEERQRSYYASVEKTKRNPKDEEDGPYGFKYTHKKFPYLLALFASSKAQESFTMALRGKPVKVTGMGDIPLKCHATERTITPVLKYMAVRQLPSAGWMKGRGTKVSAGEKESTRMHEYCVSFEDMMAMTDDQSMKMPIVLPTVMSFDNEANSSIMSSMPKTHRPDDKTFQIGYTMMDPPVGDKPKQYRKYLLSLGHPHPIEGVTITKYRTEADLMVGLTTRMREEDPEVVLGFNILGFDINYMIERAKNMCRCMGEFDMMGCIDGKHAKEEKISWGSSGAGKNEFKYLDADGRLFIDMLPYIKRAGYKLPNYRMKTCCEEFLGEGENKDDVSVKEIFRSYRLMKQAKDEPENAELQKTASAALARVGAYCVQDSYVCLLLYEKLLTWFDLTESATTNQVSIFNMYTAGQQIKMYSQVYRYGFHNNIVIESDAYQCKDNEHFTGAYVSEPIKGLYDRIVPFDFCLSGDTLISMSNGSSKKIKDLDKEELVLGYKKGGLSNFKFINGLLKKGEKDTVKIWLHDGNTIVSTPDHKFMVASEEWVRADELKGKSVICGLEYPEDIIGDDEKDWNAQFGYLSLNMTDKREDSLAFTRIIGYLKAMRIKSNDMEWSFETLFDTKNFNLDICRVYDLVKSFYNMEEFIGLLESIKLDITNYPLSLIREFMAGLFGGMSYELLDYVMLQFPEAEMSDYFEKLLNRFNLEEIVNWKCGVIIKLSTFLKNIGFKYAINKTCRFNTIGSHDEKLPTFLKHVIDVTSNGLEMVYDIEVEDAGNFIANGVVTHNCSLYPSIMMAYNIDYSKLVTDSKIPDEDCHVMIWSEHYNCGCPKDEKPLKTKATKNKDGTVKKVCSEFKYRWLKHEVSGKGIIPTLLENLIGARKRTRKIIASNEVEIKLLKKTLAKESWTPEDYGLFKKRLEFLVERKEKIPEVLQIEDQEEIDLELAKDRIACLGLINMVLDRRQNAFKINANSMYGATGVKKGYLPFLPAAMCVTYMGRTNIMKVNKYIEEEAGGKVIYNDSVMGYTPILVKSEHGLVGYRMISELGTEWGSHHGDKEESSSEYQVWSDLGWTKINRVIRHSTSKTIYRIGTHTGVVDCTQDHSLVNFNGVEISPEDCTFETNLLSRDLPEVIERDTISPEEAFIWGFFFADGSCGVYGSGHAIKYSWALNNQDRQLLEKCIRILETVETGFTGFKILETMKSSHVYKLVPFGGSIRDLVSKYQIMYTERVGSEKRWKRVPDVILNAPRNVRQGFFEGYYAGDGGKTNNVVFDCKGQIGAAGLNYIAYSLGYKISINSRFDKQDIFTQNCTRKSFRKKQDQVKAIWRSTDNIERIVYDLETENHHFAAGIGRLIVHNTDSAYCYFPEFDDLPITRLWSHALKIKADVKRLFPAPMVLDFEEKIYKKFLILTKKRYAAQAVDEQGNFDIGKDGNAKLLKRGIILQRRDNSKLLRDCYQTLVFKIFEYHEELVKLKAIGDMRAIMDHPMVKELMLMIVFAINDLFQWKSTLKDFVITKQITRDVKDYKNPDKLQGHVLLGERMKKRGIPVGAGTRVEYVIIKTKVYKKDDAQKEKIEDIGYFTEFRDIMRISRLDYLKQFINPIDELINVVMCVEGFVKQQFEHRIVHSMMVDRIASLGAPRIIFQDSKMNQFLEFPDDDIEA